MRTRRDKDGTKSPLSALKLDQRLQAIQMVVIPRATEIRFIAPDLGWKQPFNRAKLFDQAIADNGQT
jgi:hypothetical protein